MLLWLLKEHSEKMPTRRRLSEASDWAQSYRALLTLTSLITSSDWPCNASKAARASSWVPVSSWANSKRRSPLSLYLMTYLVV